MNEHQHERIAIDARIGQSKPVIILSDFDNTLCDVADFDAGTNNHTPFVHPSVLDMAKRLPLVVATGRRANHPWLPEMWRSGLVHPVMPIITENGGVLKVSHEGGEIEDVLLAPNVNVSDLEAWAQDVAVKHDFPRGERLAVKRGLTMLVMRTQNKEGVSQRADQSELKDLLESVGLPEGFVAVHSGTSVSLQHESINKGRAFRELLAGMAIERSGVEVIGMGDSTNDTEIFEEADVSVGVHPDVSHLVSIAGRHGLGTAKLVLGTEFANPPVDFNNLKAIPQNVPFWEHRLAQEREKIDQCDKDEIRVRAERFQATRNVGLIKKLSGLPPVDFGRESAQFNKVKVLAEQHGIPPQLEQDILRLKIDAVVKEHEAC